MSHPPDPVRAPPPSLPLLLTLSPLPSRSQPRMASPTTWIPLSAQQLHITPTRFISIPPPPSTQPLLLAVDALPQVACVVRSQLSTSVTSLALPMTSSPPRIQTTVLPRPRTFLLPIELVWVPDALLPEMDPSPPSFLSHCGDHPSILALPLQISPASCRSLHPLSFSRTLL